jgi:hypothetical protein
MTDITRFKAIFSGLDIAYGTYKIEGSRGDGKQAGRLLSFANLQPMTSGKNTLKV